MEQAVEVPPPRGSFGALVRACRHRAFLSQEQLQQAQAVPRRRYPLRRAASDLPGNDRRRIDQDLAPRSGPVIYKTPPACGYARSGNAGKTAGILPCGLRADALLCLRASTSADRAGEVAGAVCRRLAGTREFREELGPAITGSDC